MSRNTELFDAIADRIEAEPHRYDQSDWWTLARDGAGNICGTAFCIAGWAVELTVGTMKDKTSDGLMFLRPNGDYWADTAAVQLGIDDDEADVLFGAAWMEGEQPSRVADALRRIGRGADINDPWGDDA